MARLAQRVVHHLKRNLIPPTQPVTALPVLDMTRIIERGRCAYDGYQRGSALAHGTLAGQVWNDPLFRRALTAARLPQVRSMCTEPRLMNLFLLTKYTGFDPEVNSGGQSSTIIAVDNGNYPNSRTITFGLSFSL